MVSANSINSTAYADHLRGCADLAKEIAGRMDIRDDAARQACLATIIISADRHNLFLEPVPPNTKTPIEPNGAPAAVDAEELAAQKVDAQINDVPKHTTPEQAEEGRRTALLKGINGAVELLNKEGHEPKITPGGLNAYIKKEFPSKTNLGSLDSDELEQLTKKLSNKIDELREKKKAKAATQGADDWP